MMKLLSHIISLIKGLFSVKNVQNANILGKVQKTLLKSTETEGIELLRNTVDELQGTLGSIECSLWYVNTYEQSSANQSESSNSSNSTSLIHRLLADEIKKDFDFRKETDFVHTLDEGLFKQVMAICKSKDAESPVEYVRCTRKEVEKYNYLSVDFLKYLDGKYEQNDFIVIPIVSKVKEKEIIAILEFCFSNANYSRKQWDEMAHIIRSFFSSAFNRYSMISKHQLMMDIVKAHRQDGEEYSLAEVFKRTIDTVLDEKRSHCHCEAASFFMWDTYNFRYNLIYTTSAIDSEAQKNIVYRRGDKELIGKVATTGHAIIVNNLEPYIKDANPIEIKDISNPKTAIIIPITRISSSEVVGILQLVNKHNSNSPKNLNLVDYFSELDLEILESTTSYLALVIEYFIKEEEQRNFIDKLSHELMTPARSVRNDADRIKRKKDDDEFVGKQLYSYIDDILSLSETQIWQVRTNLYQVRNPENRKSKYKIEKVLLSEILKKSKDAVIPIAREYDVRFNEIRFAESLTTINVDEEAFVTVFYNLFTNAIKYNDPTRPFLVRANYYSTENGMIIEVEDNGLGIKEEEKDNIFHLGYRGTEIMRQNADGFGVGLTTVKQILDDFGGTIKVTNFKQPTRFTITLPSNIIHNEKN